MEDGNGTANASISKHWRKSILCMALTKLFAMIYAIYGTNWALVRWDMMVLCLLLLVGEPLMYGAPLFAPMINSGGGGGIFPQDGLKGGPKVNSASSFSAPETFPTTLVGTAFIFVADSTAKGLRAVGVPASSFSTSRYWGRQGFVDTLGQIAVTAIFTSIAVCRSERVFVRYVYLTAALMWYWSKASANPVNLGMGSTADTMGRDISPLWKFYDAASDALDRVTGRDKQEPLIVRLFRDCLSRALNLTIYTSILPVCCIEVHALLYDSVCVFLQVAVSYASFFTWLFLYMYMYNRAQIVQELRSRGQWQAVDGVLGAAVDGKATKGSKKGGNGNVWKSKKRYLQGDVVTVMAKTSTNTNKGIPTLWKLKSSRACSTVSPLVAGSTTGAWCWLYSGEDVGPVHQSGLCWLCLIILGLLCAAQAAIGIFSVRNIGILFITSLDVCVLLFTRAFVLSNCTSSSWFF
jgi:hypothetical protein